MHDLDEKQSSDAKLAALQIVEQADVGSKSIPQKP